MAEPLLVLDDILHPNYSVVREMIAPQLQAPLGAGAIQTRRQWVRPLSRFRLRAQMVDKPTATAIWAFYAYVQSDKPFRFSGLQYGDFTMMPLFVGFGDGVTRDVLLPNRNVSVVQMYVGTRTTLGQTYPLVTSNTAAGSVTMASAPAVNSYIRAGYKCWYRCIFSAENEMLLSEEWRYTNTSYFEQITLLEVPF
jgi:hypothetical protein